MARYPRVFGSSSAKAQSRAAHAANGGGTPTPTPGPTPPAAPSIAVTSGNASNSIAWTDGATGSSPITGHKVYSSTTQGFTPAAGNLVGSPTGASPFGHTGLANGVLRYYRVTAVNAAGESAPSAEASGTPTAGAQTANQALLAATPKDGSMLLAVLEGSRGRQNGIGTTNANGDLRAMASGQVTQAKRKRRFRSPFYWSNGPDVNSQYMSGMLFADDGEGSPHSYRRVPALVASDAQVVLMSLSSNSVQTNNLNIYNQDLGTSLTPEGYWANYQIIIDELIAGGKAVIVGELIERGSYLKNGTPLNGVWAPGSATRNKVLAINAYAKARCQEQGIPFWETHDLMTETVNGDIVPKAAYVRDDTTHWSTIGAQVLADSLNAFLAANGFTGIATPDPAAAGNLVSNPDMTAGSSGAPTGYALSRSGTTSGLTWATVAKDGKQWLEATIDASALGSAQEGVTITPTVGATASGTWYIARFRFEQDAWDGWYGTAYASASAGGVVSRSVLPMDAGGSGVTALSDTGVDKAPSAAITGWIETEPFLATGTSNTLVIRPPVWRGASGVGKFRLTDVEFRPTSDPRLLMYDEADTGQPTITSNASPSAPEEQKFVFQLAANKKVRWSISGPDAALFTVDTHGRLVLTVTPDFEQPADANGDNVYSITVTATQRNPNAPVATQSFNLSITDVNDGFFDNFTGTAGTDVATRTGWTGIGAANAVVIANNRAASNTAGGSARGAVLAPQQGDTADQQAEWTAPTTSAGAYAAVNVVDVDNFLGLRFNSGVPRVVRMNAGTETNLSATTAVSLYKSLATSDVLKLQRLSNQLRLYQNDVLVWGPYDVTGILENARLGGIVSTTASSSNNQAIDNMRVRTAVPIVEKVALKALTLTNDKLTAGQVYAGTVGNYTGAPQLQVTTDSSGLGFFMDGFNLRSTSPLGASGTVYTVTVSESNDNAATPNPKTTTFTITVP